MSVYISKVETYVSKKINRTMKIGKFSFLLLSVAFGARSYLSDANVETIALFTLIDLCSNGKQLIKNQD